MNYSIHFVMIEKQEVLLIHYSTVSHIDFGNNYFKVNLIFQFTFYQLLNSLFDYRRDILNSLYLGHNL